MFLKLILTVLTFSILSSPASAFMGGKKGNKCAKEHKCKELKGEEKVQCWAKRSECADNQHKERMTKLKALSPEKLAKRKPKIIERMKKRISKTEEKMEKLSKKMGEMKDKGKNPEKMAQRAEMKTKRLEHMKNKLTKMKAALAEVEAL